MSNMESTSQETEPQNDLLSITEQSAFPAGESAFPPEDFISLNKYNDYPQVQCYQEPPEEPSEKKKKGKKRKKSTYTDPYLDNYLSKKEQQIYRTMSISHPERAVGFLTVRKRLSEAEARIRELLEENMRLSMKLITLQEKMLSQ